MSIMGNSSRIAGSFFISVPVRLAWLSLIVLICSFPTPAQTEQSPARPVAVNDLPHSPTPKIAVDASEDLPKVPGTITGTVVGQDGIAVVGAKVTLSAD